MTMKLAVHPEAPPLRQDADGSLRIADTRVLLDMVIRAFQDGATPEAIVQRYPTVSLSNVYAAIAYYLRHQGEVDAYLLEREKQAEKLRSEIEAKQGDLSAIRSRLNSHRDV